jgi:microsomal dipeptidase-like Zn-dependent dipeptidase
MSAATAPDDLMIPTAAEREEMIAVAAYFLAEHRGFVPGGADDDWLHAERQIDAMIEAMRRQGVTRAQFERAGMRNALRMWSRVPPED